MRAFLAALLLLAGCAGSRLGPGAPIRPQSEPAGPMLSQQRYLEGVIYYQKGDYEKARASWEDAVKLDPANEDAKAGLARIKTLYGDE